MHQVPQNNMVSSRPQTTNRNDKIKTALNKSDLMNTKMVMSQEDKFATVSQDLREVEE